MPSINTRQLRDTRQLIAWLEAGEVVELRKRNRVVGRIVPEAPGLESLKGPAPMPDFAARRRAPFGGYVLPENIVVEARKDSRY
jgi:antitoxin (DNA-binding transcriptional repressor) of toxin-antitoxin stability system